MRNSKKENSNSPNGRRFINTDEFKSAPEYMRNIYHDLCREFNRASNTLSILEDIDEFGSYRFKTPNDVWKGREKISPKNSAFNLKPTIRLLNEEIETILAAKERICEQIVEDYALANGELAKAE